MYVIAIRVRNCNLLSLDIKMGNIVCDYPVHAKPFSSMPCNLDLGLKQLILICFY